MIDLFLGNKTAFKILRVLSEAPGKFVERSELKRLTGSGNRVLSASLERLELFGIVLKKKIGKKHYYSLNPPNLFVKSIIELCKTERINLKALPPSKINFISRVVEKLLYLDPREIYLFGSYAKGTYDDMSDFDFAVVGAKDEVVDLPENVEVHFFSEMEFKGGGGLVFEIKKDGIKLV